MLGHVEFFIWAPLRIQWEFQIELALVRGHMHMKRVRAHRTQAHAHVTYARAHMAQAHAHITRRDIILEHLNEDARA